MAEKKTNWPPIGFEEFPWERDADARDLIPESRRRKITGTYRAAVPLEIRAREMTIPEELKRRLEELTAVIIRFDERQRRVEYDLPALLVRQPVVDSRFVAEHLGVSERAVRDIVQLGCSCGMLRPIGGGKRKTLYQSDALIDIMESITACIPIRHR